MFNCCKGCALANKMQDNIKRLSDLNIGDEANVISVAGDDDLRIKIMEMGVVSGSLVKVIKKAPLGDPLAISIRGYDLTLRKNEADVVLVNHIKK